MCMIEIAQMRKALVPVVVGLVLAALGHLGIAESMTVRELAEFAALGVLVWLVPNKK